MTRRSVPTLLVIGLLGACSDSGGPEGPSENQQVGPPAVLLIVAGDGQHGTAGLRLPAPVVLQVLDSSDRPIVNQTVTFLVTAGQGSVSADTGYTDGSGKVQVEWTLGPTPGEAQTLYVELPDDASDGGRISTTLTAVAEPPPTTVRFNSVVAGGRYTLGLTGEGRLYWWGMRGTDGVSSPYPAAFPGDLTFATMDVGFAHSCAITTAGAAYCWGQNGSGQLGDGTTSDHNNPGLVAGGHTFREIGAGIEHTCALNTAGEAYCWGGMGTLFQGRLGDGTTTGRPTPTRVTGGLTFQSLAVGGVSCGLTPEGKAYCWGARIGTQTGESNLVPTLVSGDLTFTSISAGGDHVCGLTAAGKAYCWGGNFSGELGDGTHDPTPTPVAVAGGFTFSAIGAGGEHTCGVTTSGALACWGWNDQVVDSREFNGGTSINSTTPVPVPGAPVFVQISEGLIHGCGITAEQAAYCWFDNVDGQLGTGDRVSSYQPVPVR